MVLLAGDLFSTSSSTADTSSSPGRDGGGEGGRWTAADDRSSSLSQCGSGRDMEQMMGLRSRSTVFPRVLRCFRGSLGTLQAGD